MKDHNGKDTSSYTFKYCVAADHQFISCSDLKIVGRNYSNNKQTENSESAIN